MEAAEEIVALIADESYASEEMAEKAAHKNTGLITTGLCGRKPREIPTQFSLSDDDYTVAKCLKDTRQKSASISCRLIPFRFLLIDYCENCPHQKECKAKIKAHTAVLIFSFGVTGPCSRSHQTKG